MNADDANLRALELVSQRLEPKLDEFLFVGGATLGLFLTDPAARRPRVSKDVDVVVQVASLAEYSITTREFLLSRGFVEAGSENAPVCRWTVDGVVVDVMSVEPVLGFTNQWFRGAFAEAERQAIGSLSILRATAPYFLAMKLEAFEGRGCGDYYGSDDVEDVLTLVDGRPELLSELRDVTQSVSDFVSGRTRLWLSDREFLNALPGHLDTGREAVVLTRLRAIAELDRRPQ